MRVHALAKEYGIKSTEFVDIIQEFGVGIKSHLSVLDDGQVADINQIMENRERILHEYASEETVIKETELELTESDLDEESFDEYDDGEGSADDDSDGSDGIDSDSDDTLQVESVEQVDIGDSYTEEVSPYQYQEVVIEKPTGFWGWLKSLFS